MTLHPIVLMTPEQQPEDNHEESNDSSSEEHAADRIGAVDSPSETDSRIGSVDLDDVFLTQAPQLEDSEAFKQMADRLHVSEEVFASLQKSTEFHLETLLTETLDGLVSSGNLDGMMIASDEGLVIAQSASVDQGDILAAMGSLFEATVSRAQNENLIQAVEEMTLRGFAGEQIVVRYFPNLEQNYFLVAHSAKHCAYRRDTTRALKICGELLNLALRHSPDKLRKLLKRIETLRSHIPQTPAPSSEPAPMIVAPSVTPPSVTGPSVDAPSIESPSPNALEPTAPEPTQPISGESGPFDGETRNTTNM